MTVAVTTVLIVACCVVIGLALHVLDAPGRAKRARRAQERRAQADSPDVLEARFQAERGGDLAPTHERP